MTENDYIAEYIKERRPELLTCWDYIGWLMCRKLKDALRSISEVFSRENQQEEETEDAQIDEETPV